ncbi:MAG: NifU-like protein [candidate division WS2 bacterium ADurb.Bin280]|uniref:NifU-like protein n=1 Tax=candidate division WS2 bacterium ADurb.Bin280 TaxID=1852829 RepID=A0A1V5SFL6_9BACT|nr:MAG: NifU-like protein [candidate division WS2 bacterium ADurb.Bin280]
MSKDDIKEDRLDGWIYSKIVEDHFFNPRNVLLDDQKEGDFDAIGVIGSPACGDVMKVYLKIRDDIIMDFKWKTFGCASAIASTSVLSEMVVGKSIEEAYKIGARQIIEVLGGLPPKKIHCSIMGDRALRLAIDDYKERNRS